MIAVISLTAWTSNVLFPWKNTEYSSSSYSCLISLLTNSGTHWNSTFSISTENFDFSFKPNEVRFIYKASNQTLTQGTFHTEQVQNWKKLKLSKYNHFEITCQSKKMLKSQKIWALWYLTDMISIFKIKISSQSDVLWMALMEGFLSTTWHQNSP